MSFCFVVQSNQGSLGEPQPFIAGPWRGAWEAGGGYQSNVRAAADDEVITGGAAMTPEARAATMRC
jgi:hypothetical protein